MTARRAPAGPDLPGDERIAREEISTYYAGRVAKAREAYERALAELNAAEDAQRAWEESGEIRPTGRYAKATPEQAAAYQQMHLGMLVADSQGRYMAAARELLRPALDAPNPQVGVAELHRLGDRPDFATRRAEVDALHERTHALQRWLAAQGHTLPGDETPKQARRRAGGPR